MGARELAAKVVDECRRLPNEPGGEKDFLRISVDYGLPEMEPWTTLPANSQAWRSWQKATIAVRSTGWGSGEQDCTGNPALVESAVAAAAAPTAAAK